MAHHRRVYRGRVWRGRMTDPAVRGDRCGAAHHAGIGPRRRSVEYATTATRAFLPHHPLAAVLVHPVIARPSIAVRGHRWADGLLLLAGVIRMRYRDEKLAYCLRSVSNRAGRRSGTATGSPPSFLQPLRAYAAEYAGRCYSERRRCRRGPQKSSRRRPVPRPKVGGRCSSISGTSIEESLFRAETWTHRNGCCPADGPGCGGRAPAH